MVLASTLRWGSWSDIERRISARGQIVK